MSSSCKMKHQEHCDTKIVPSHFPCNCPTTKRIETNMKCCWETNYTDVQTTVFVSPGQCRLIASGMINYECNSATASGVAMVRFYQGAPGTGALVGEYRLDEGSCLTFVASNFNTITISSNTVPAQGEICISPHYKLPCN